MKLFEYCKVTDKNKIGLTTQAIWSAQCRRWLALLQKTNLGQQLVGGSQPWGRDRDEVPSVCVSTHGAEGKKTRSLFSVDTTSVERSLQRDSTGAYIMAFPASEEDLFILRGMLRTIFGVFRSWF